MPYWGCTKCHHEWEGGEWQGTCDWCGAPGRILEDKTPLEKMASALDDETARAIAAIDDDPARRRRLRIKVRKPRQLRAIFREIGYDVNIRLVWGQSWAEMWRDRVAALNDHIEEERGRRLQAVAPDASPASGEENEEQGR